MAFVDLCEFSEAYSFYNILMPGNACSADYDFRYFRACI